MKITPTQARRLAVTRQRLAGPPLPPTRDGLMEMFRDLGCVQIDPIRAVERTQYLVPFSRLGRYDVADLHALLYTDRQLFEYWAHAASIVLTEDYPIHESYMRYNRQDLRIDGSSWARWAKTWYAENEPFRQYVLDELRERGPLTSAQLEDRSVTPWGRDGWNNGRNVSRLLDMLWSRGEIMVAGRKGLQKQWTLTERHLPDWTPREELSRQELTRRAAQKSLRALGVGTAKQITAHFTRDRYPKLAAVLAQLAADEVIIPVEIAEGGVRWPGEWYIHAEDAPLVGQLDNSGWQPRTVLLSPFDNLICDRARTELMWDFHFRIEIYVPKAKRQYGYYVLPILHGDRLIGRIDPKMDRKSGTLHVNAVYAEPDAPQDSATARAVAAA
ncbi:MAG: winged helix-turn-helix domain-containing protein, partial [Chloroflexi bacterium]